MSHGFVSVPLLLLLLRFQQFCDRWQAMEPTRVVGDLLDQRCAG
jgi:hypothetical protein